MKVSCTLLIPSSHLSFVDACFFSSNIKRDTQRNQGWSVASTNGPPCITSVKKKARRKRTCSSAAHVDLPHAHVVISMIDKLEKVNNQWWYARVSSVVQFFPVKSLIYWYISDTSSYKICSPSGWSRHDDLSRRQGGVIWKISPVQCRTKFMVLEKFNYFFTNDEVYSEFWRNFETDEKLCCNIHLTLWTICKFQFYWIYFCYWEVWKLESKILKSL